MRSAEFGHGQFDNIQIYVLLLEAKLLTAREAYQILRDIALGVRSMRRLGEQSWAEIYCGLMTVEADGWVSRSTTTVTRSTIGTAATARRDVPTFLTRCSRTVPTP